MSSKYRDSREDKQLRFWFNSDMTCALLKQIDLSVGGLRGLEKCKLTLNYPITAIAGRNGAGKSTLLAMACCAFHAKSNQYRLPGRKHSYYTFSDFFFQHTNEVPPAGIEIYYQIAYNSWRKSADHPEGVGLAFQKRWKVKGGKWNNYVTRAIREVVFLGIGRIVPPSELSATRTYSKSFKLGQPKGWEVEVKEIVGLILGKRYDELHFLEYSRYILPIVQIAGRTYSGFNMGAGESALFEIFRVIFSCEKGALIVVDEIELGLHIDAQRKLIRSLKDVCVKRRVQIICTTHSQEIFQCLPPDARKYVEKIGSATVLTEGISPDFAMAKMGAPDAKELHILVEDGMAAEILAHSLPTELRLRVRIVPVGSASALSRQLAAAYARKEDRKILAFFDGDQRRQQAVNIKHARDMAELVDSDFLEWVNARMAYLPGDDWPEKWVAANSKSVITDLAHRLQIDETPLDDLIDCGLQAGKHNEFFEIARCLALEKAQCVQHFLSSLCNGKPQLFSDIGAIVRARLDAAD